MQSRTADLSPKVRVIVRLHDRKTLRQIAEKLSAEFGHRVTRGYVAVVIHRCRKRGLIDTVADPKKQNHRGKKRPAQTVGVTLAQVPKESLC